MPYKVHESAMISTSDGKGVILSGGYNGGLNNGWNLIMENITCGDGNHE